MERRGETQLITYKRGKDFCGSGKQTMSGDAHQVLEGGDGCPDAGVISDLLGFVERHVQVGTHLQCYDDKGLGI